MSKREPRFDDEDLNDEEDGYRDLLRGKRRRRLQGQQENGEAETANDPPPQADPSLVKANSQLSRSSSPESGSNEATAIPAESSTLYLDTVDRARLDFDFEKVCSVSLSNNNVYACMTCGKYFQGRGRNSHAYFHSVDQNHHVYINLQTLKVYVLPEGYEVTNPALDDIKYVADPVYTKAQVNKLDKITETAYDLQHTAYRPGFIGINNIKQNDYANAVIQALAHVAPLRNFMMLEKDAQAKAENLKRFSVLVRKIWNPRAFKPHVSPQELLQYISLVSNKRFTPTVQKDPFEFMNYLLNSLHLALGGSKSRPQSSIIHMIFQGRLQIQTQKITSRSIPGDRLRFEANEEVQLQEMPFMFLSLDLPPAPLFKGDLDQNNAIPQVLLTTLLAKYDGTTTQELAGHRKRYKILRLPPFLTFHVKRFNSKPSDAASSIDDRNPTVVSFGPQNLDMSPFVEGAVEPIYYDLVANITHELNTAAQGEGETHVWKIQLLDKAAKKWVQIQDLVIEDVRPELLFLSESYIQIWERRK